MGRQTVLTVLAIKASDFPRGFALYRPFLQIGAFVPGYLALSDAELGFEFPVFPVKFQHD
jgi:hypothetical protein